ncbi:MAG: CAP domain-containing protein [Candidatus Eremiobacteraeota bacterium]|nr:CAP domain-containing protein [Candidatus Eremiobacteraeota bacterium]
MLSTLLVSLASIAIARPLKASCGGDAYEVRTLLASMNAARRSKHLRPLMLDRRLCRVAHDHALDMARRGYFGHTTPEGEDAFDRMTASKCRFGYAGENLAIGLNARVIFHDFWESYEHRLNMLGGHYLRVGIASIESAVGTIVVEDFSD